MTPHDTRLMIVYNADGGILNALKDMVHKIASPATYPCALCGLTYGAVSMRREWRRFLDSLRLSVVFHHRDDFAEAYPRHSFELPAILIQDHDNPPRVLVSAAEMSTMSRLDDLITRVEKNLSIERQRPPALKVVA